MWSLGRGLVAIQLCFLHIEEKRLADFCAGEKSKMNRRYSKNKTVYCISGESDATPQEDKRQTPAYSPYHAIVMLKRFLFIHFKTIY